MFGGKKKTKSLISQATQKFKKLVFSNPMANAETGVKSEDFEFTMIHASVKLEDEFGFVMVHTNAEVELIMAHAGVSREKAIEALEDSDGDVVCAAMRLLEEEAMMSEDIEHVMREVRVSEEEAIKALKGQWQESGVAPIDIIMGRIGCNKTRGRDHQRSQ